ncbi:2-oxoacid:acceptor oxidoreductase family protein [Alkalicella caledoniensis]|uniref:2-oxoacid:acceptor oxidoreductase family protein n=1 Tax=Alkalicella caledoniensis TaxID=2731377 RepID=A0A7G9WBX3_ALKCA|nr:2-oxoacid:acceptor oxidoreductase family protein [Alkalicella caledoniensis]QNO16185.1 2-oxoacid:acceptor oxidoreductase family protein [Alkalicella caledoniensis]
MIDMILAGFGGQGVMSMGQLVAYSGMIEGKEVSWMPSYGPEMRGGTANCTVVVSEDPIGSPVVVEPQVVVAMNLPSLDKFESMVKPGGVLIINSSLINRTSERDDITVIEVPANEIANELGNARVANMVVLGTVIGQTNVVTKESVIESLKKVLPEHRHNLIPMNESAIDKGAAYAK